MGDYSGLLIGGGVVAVLSLVGLAWDRIKPFLNQATSAVFVPLEIYNSYLAAGILKYLNEEYRSSPFGIRGWTSIYIYHRKASRYRHVAFERLGSGPRSFWKHGFLPIWVSQRGAEEDARKQSGRASEQPVLMLRYIRGTFSARALIRTAIRYLNAEEEYLDDKGKFQVTYFFGEDQSASGNEHRPNFTSLSVSDWSFASVSLFRRAHKPLDSSWSELGPLRREHALGLLALNAAQEQAAAEIKHWADSEAWYRDRGIPWKRGYLLYGQPGCGKTSFVRAVAEECDLPVYVFDLATLSNSELVRYWRSAASEHTRRIYLIEDLDGVFDQRKNVAQTEYHQGVTFDSLLNLIDGVDKLDGTLLFISTNHPETLDAALGGLTTGDDKIAPRPGRIDRSLCFDGIDDEGRRKIARRIVQSNTVDALIVEGRDDTPAQFQERCYRHVLSQRFLESPADSK